MKKMLLVLGLLNLTPIFGAAHKLAGKPKDGLAKIEKTWLIFNRLFDVLERPTHYFAPTRSHYNNDNEVYDPTIQFWHDVFKMVAKVIRPKEEELSLSERQIFVEQLEVSYAKNTSFYVGFMLCFLRRAVFPALRKHIKSDDLKQMADVLREFLQGSGFISPVLPAQLCQEEKLPEDYEWTTLKELANSMFNEFFAIHHYCLAWSMSAHQSEDEIDALKKQNQQITQLQRLHIEIEELEMVLKKEEGLLRQDQVKTERAKEQKLRRIEELSVAEKELEFVKLQHDVDKQNEHDELLLSDERMTLQSKWAKEKSSNEHNDKLLALERQKQDLEAKYQTLSFFEKTVQRFSECLSAVVQMKQH